MGFSSSRKGTPAEIQLDLDRFLEYYNLSATRAIAEWPHADAGAPRRPRGRRTAAAGLS